MFKVCVGLDGITITDEASGEVINGATDISTKLSDEQLTLVLEDLFKISNTLQVSISEICKSRRYDDKADFIDRLLKRMI